MAQLSFAKMEGASADNHLECAKTRKKHSNMDPKICLQIAPWLNQFPYLSIEHAPRLLFVTTQMIAKNFEDFTWATNFDPKFLTELMRHGFLPMATEAVDGLIVLLPKLHRERCVLNIDDLCIQRGARKRAKNFSLTVNTAFDQVVDGIRKQHGKECWFYPQLVESFLEIYESPELFDEPSKPKVRIVSFELWTNHNTDKKDSSSFTKQLVGGEIGFTVGLVYTSLSGFSIQSSAGSIQMASTGLLLQKQNCLLWDLGMGLPYKMKLGAKNIPRKEFVNKIMKSKLIKGDFDFIEYKDHHNAHDILKDFLEKKAKLKINENIEKTFSHKSESAAEPDLPPPPIAETIRTNNNTNSSSSSSSNVNKKAKEDDKEEEAQFFIPIGTKVQIIDLKSRPELNGSFGIVKKFVPTSGRWLIQLDNEAGAFALMKSNIIVLEH